MNERPTKKFLCEYHHDGFMWALEITAYDHEDAEARVNKLGNLKLCGEIGLEIPAGPYPEMTLWVPKWYCAFANWLGRDKELLAIKLVFLTLFGFAVGRLIYVMVP